MNIFQNIWINIVCYADSCMGSKQHLKAGKPTFAKVKSCAPCIHGYNL